MGLKHFHGHGVQQDRQEAMKWFKKAADQVKSLSNASKIGHFQSKKVLLNSSRTPFQMVHLEYFWILSLVVLTELEIWF